MVGRIELARADADAAVEQVLLPPELDQGEILGVEPPGGAIQRADLATEIDEDRAAMKAESQAPKADPPQDSQSETEMVPMRSSDESGTTSGPAPASAGDTGAMVAPPETVDATGIRPNEVPGAVETPSQGVSNDAAAADALEDDGPAPWFIPVGIAVAMLVLLLVAIYAF